jgi:RNA polymerase sigma-70 factor, ECF subfamily
VTDISDQELIGRASKGDQQAFQAIVVRYERRVAAAVIGMLGYCPEADDVGQEVFIRFYRAMDTFRGDAGLGTYLTRIAINLSLNELKKRKRRQVFQFFSGTEARENEIPDYVDEAGQRAVQEHVQRALQMLEPDFRSVVVLRMIEGFSTRETAEMLDLPQGTVLSRLARAQKKLKGILEEVS